MHVWLYHVAKGSSRLVWKLVVNDSITYQCASHSLLSQQRYPHIAAIVQIMLEG